MKGKKSYFHSGACLPGYQAASITGALHMHIDPGGHPQAFNFLELSCNLKIPVFFWFEVLVGSQTNTCVPSAPEDSSLLLLLSFVGKGHPPHSHYPYCSTLHFPEPRSGLSTTGPECWTWPDGSRQLLRTFKKAALDKKEQYSFPK